MSAPEGPETARVKPLLGGFTLLEVLVALGIVAVLAVLLLPSAGGVVKSAREAACIANLSSIHKGLTSYLEDNGRVWPQGPSPADENEWGKFWLLTLSNYDVPPKTWQCPSILASLGQRKSADSQIPALHYMPTRFDATPGICDRWTTQPWLIERANAHGHGCLLCFPDGSVKPLAKVLAEQGFR